MTVYGGYIDDNGKLLESASGGIATALAEKMIFIGGYVAGVAYDSTYKNIEYVLINSFEEIQRLKGSKYAESRKNGIYKKVKDLLAEGKQVLFIGLPCEVSALKKVVGKEYDSLITCELICHGPTSIKVHQEYLSYLERKQKSTIVDFNVRYKKHGWEPSYLRAVFANGAVFERPFYETEYGRAFAIMTRRACFQCMFKDCNTDGDIMIGDYWGAKPGDPFWNDNGVSVIFVHNNKGQVYLDSLENIRLFESDYDHAVKPNQNVITQRQLPYNYDKFAEQFAQHGLFYAVKRRMGMKKRLVAAVKHMIPASALPFIKKMYNAKFR